MTVISSNDSRGFLLADGEKLAVSFPTSGRMLLVSTYYPVSFSINTDNIEISAYGDPHSNFFYMPIQESIEISISGYGPIESIPLEEGMKLFRNADSMSVNELLAVAYQKMNNRKSS
jgi:hypothetical protein